ncbi:MAG TPA: sugar ABC transporter permease [Candidatus Ornithomonoglobus intestinigallinarum]|uniref:Sugar ABC transporter permease n=1 Tax=Candidatus Ornithomonoglobus intestinigallinarum TaxID=2840894 RepID=A0A9D1H4J0_9FIRM|nr:sugar ABC transporter permease [Candidatus Ornithomonoglobus intestinigallinarum]
MIAKEVGIAMKTVGAGLGRSKNHTGLLKKIKDSDRIQCYLLIALPLIGFFVFTLYPILWSAVKSFYYYDLVPSNTRFVGLKNFITLFTNGEDYWKAWLFTFKYMFIKLPIEIPLALILAVFLSKNLKLSGFFRNMYYLPCVISMAIIGIIFANIFDPFGIVNAWLLKLNVITEPIDWFGDTNKALFVLVLGGIWSSFGTNVVYFTAALSNVPKDLYEAAEIDGAGVFRKFFSVTVPMISNVFQTILLLAINGTLRTGEYIIVMTNGAPAGTTLTAEAYVMKSFLPGFSTGTPDLGYGCALSVISSIICAGIGLLYLRASRKMTELY